MNIGIIFGSRSPEHEVSITSAFGIMKAIEKHTNHTTVPLYITKKGEWMTHPALKDITSFKNLDTFDSTFFPLVKKEDGYTFIIQPTKGFFGRDKKQQVDVLWNLCHGENGEDGVISGFAQLLNIPIISPGVMGESVGLDKQMMKRVFNDLGLPLVPYVVYYKDNIDYSQIEKELSYPLFVKPVNLGSSIGVSKCENHDELLTAIEVAGHFDSEIMIEESVENLIELNCSVMMNDGKVVTSLVEQPSTDDVFLTFDEKYTSSNGSTMKGAKGKVKIPADIPRALMEEVQNMCKVIYLGLKLRGGAPRVDFLYDQVAKKVYVNEINMIPGVMQIYLRVESGRSVRKFVSTLINTAQTEWDKRQKNIHFNSNIIDHTISFIDNQS